MEEYEGHQLSHVISVINHETPVDVRQFKLCITYYKVFLPEYLNLNSCLD